MTMKKLVAGVTLGLVGGVTAGLIGTSLPAGAQSTQTASDQQAVIKRKDDMVATLVAVDDEDDEDTLAKAGRKMDASRDKTTRSRFTGNSRSRADGTNSRNSPQSRNRDKSRRDMTRDWTKDGKGAQKRDWSRNHTNDRSRNDTRRGARA